MMPDGPMVGAMDPYWESLYCACTLMVPLLTQGWVVQSPIKVTQD